MDRFTASAVGPRPRAEMGLGGIVCLPTTPRPWRPQPPALVFGSSRRTAEVARHWRNAAHLASAGPAPPRAGADADAAPGPLGVVIVDHGSKRAASNDMLLEFVELYKRVTGRDIVEPAHMELAEPSVSAAVAACAARGARTVVVAPYFLSKGRHIQEDIPALVSEAQAQHPGVKCVVADPIGVDPLMAQLIDSRVGSALGAETPAQ